MRWALHLWVKTQLLKHKRLLTAVPFVTAPGVPGFPLALILRIPPVWVRLVSALSGRISLLLSRFSPSTQQRGIPPHYNGAFQRYPPFSQPDWLDEAGESPQAVSRIGVVNEAMK